MYKTSITAGIWLLMLIGWQCFGGAILTVDNGYQANLGQFPANQLRQIVFTLTNTGDATLKIKNISAGCECLNVQLDKHDAEPGEKISIRINVLPGTINGNFQKKIMILSNTSPPVNSITLFGNAKPLVEIMPGDLINAGIIPLGKTWTVERKLQTDNDAVKLGTPELKSNYPAEVELIRKNQREWSLKISVTGKVVWHNLDGIITIPILEPAGWAPLKIAYNGLLGAHLSSFQNQLFIPADPNAPFVRNIDVSLQGELVIDTAKLQFPVMDRTTFKVINSSKTSNQATIEMCREASVSAEKYDYPTLCIGYPDAHNAVIRLTKAKYMNPKRPGQESERK